MPVQGCARGCLASLDQGAVSAHEALETPLQFAEVPLVHANPHLVGFPVLTLKNVETRVPGALRAAMQAPAEPDTHAQVEAVDDPGFHSGAVVLQPSFQLPLEDTGEQPGEARTDLHEAVQALDGQEREDERPEARPAAECNPQLPQGCCIRFRELGIR